MKEMKVRSAGMAVTAALLYGLSAPVSKIILEEVPPVRMAAVLYLGAGLGMILVDLIIKHIEKETVEAKLTGGELPYLLGMIILDIAAPIFLMLGLLRTTSSNASLLNNFEIVATSLIALTFFKESIGKRMWGAILLITLSSIILSFENMGSLVFSKGSILVLMACMCWGLENNFTGKLSIKNPIQIVIIKGLGSGAGALLISTLLQEQGKISIFVLYGFLLGFVSYGLGIFFYIMAQRHLGAARTSAYYATAPFIGVLFSWILLHDPITLNFSIGLVIMLAGTYLVITENHFHAHKHKVEIHEHRHKHDEGHHNHRHDYQIIGEHTHRHAHEELEHEHTHLPDIHHRHSH